MESQEKILVFCSREIIAGVLTGATVFMVLCVVEYLVGILCLRYVRD